MDSEHSAASQVFAIAELLEPILVYAACTPWPHEEGHVLESRAVRRYTEEEFVLYQRPGDIPWGSEHDVARLKAKTDGMRWLLCKANRVDRFFHSTIANSLPLQKFLFMRWNGKEDSIPRFNPMLASKFIWGYFHRLQYPEYRHRFKKRICYEKATWRKMFPVIPPVQNVQVVELTKKNWDIQTRRSDHRLRTGRISVDGNEGLRMGMLFDIGEEWHKPTKRFKFFITWFGEFDSNQLSEYEQKELKQPWAYEVKVDEFAFASLLHLYEIEDGTKYVLIPAQKIDRVRIVLVNASELHEMESSVENKLKHQKLKSQGKEWSLKDVMWSAYDEKLEREVISSIVRMI